METYLPDSLKTGAQFAGNEYGWSVAAFPLATVAAQDISYACLGGQFQFRTANATREMYWLNADAAERSPQESWGDFVTRSCQEVREQFDRLVRGTDFVAEANRWTDFRDEIGTGSDPLDFLVFVAYFVTEAEHKSLRLAAHGA